MFKSTRDGFGEAIVELATKNKKIVVVDAGLKGSLRLVEFAKKYPDRFIEVGVAEQNMLGVAAGLALSGKTVFTTSFACFSPAICWNNIRIDVCYSNANVKIVGSHGGLATGGDGASHQALEDIALMRVLPKMVVLVPADYEQAKGLVRLASEYAGPVYLRLSRPETSALPKLKITHSTSSGQENDPFDFTQGHPEQSRTDEKLKIGGSEILREGKKLTIVGCGIVLGEAIKAAEELDAEVINCYSVKPLDTETILKSAKKTGRAITVEDHSVIGGLGSAVAEFLSQNYPVPIKILGVQDKFGESARDYRELWEKYGMDSDTITREARK